MNHISVSQAVLAVGFLVPLVVHAEDSPSNTPAPVIQIAQIDHSNRSPLSNQLDLKKNDKFKIQVINTCASHFKLSVIGAKPVRPKRTDQATQDTSTEAASIDELVNAVVADLNTKTTALVALIESGIECDPTAGGDKLESEIIVHSEGIAGYAVQIERNVAEPQALVDAIAAFGASPENLEEYGPYLDEKASMEAADSNADTTISTASIIKYTRARDALEAALARYEREEPIKIVLKDDKATELSSYTTVVFTPIPSELSIIPAGAFVVSKLVSDKYTLGTRTSPTPAPDGSAVAEQFVRRNSGADDDWALGLGAMLHVTDPAWNFNRSSTLSPAFGGTFGLAYNNNSSDLNYLIGVSLIWQNQLFVTLGGNIGKVDVLPRGLKDGDVIPVGESIDPMDSRNEAAFFFSVSWAFLGDGVEGRLKGLIAPAGGGGTAAAGGAAAE